MTSSTAGHQPAAGEQVAQRHQQGQAEAYPIWAKVTTRPGVPELVPNDLAMSSSTGWA